MNENWNLFFFLLGIFGPFLIFRVRDGQFHIKHILTFIYLSDASKRPYMFGPHYLLRKSFFFFYSFWFQWCDVSSIISCIMHSIQAKNRLKTCLNKQVTSYLFRYQPIHLKSEIQKSFAEWKHCIRHIEIGECRYKQFMLNAHCSRTTYIFGR